MVNEILTNMTQAEGLKDLHIGTCSHYLQLPPCEQFQAGMLKMRARTSPSPQVTLSQLPEAILDHPASAETMQTRKTA